MYSVFAAFQVPFTVSRSTESDEFTFFLNFKVERSELEIDEELVADVTAFTDDAKLTTTVGAVQVADVID